MAGEDAKRVALERATNLSALLQRCWAGMIALLFSVAMATAVAWQGWRLDRRLTGGQSQKRMYMSLVLLAAGTWLVTVVWAANALQSPGAYGPVQICTGADGKICLLFHVRVLSMFVVLGSMALALAVAVAMIDALCTPSSTPKWRLCALPVWALAMLALAIHEFFWREFFPTA